MIAVKRHLAATNRRRWDLCKKPPRFIGTIHDSEYAKPFLWWVWAGRSPRTFDVVLFLARRAPTGRVRTKTVTGDAAERLYRSKVGDAIPGQRVSCRRQTARRSEQHRAAIVARLKARMKELSDG